MSIFTRKSIRVTPTPFIITFHHDADGGPEHFINFLIGFCIQLSKKGWVVSHGLVISSDHQYVTLREWDADKRDYVGPIRKFDFWQDFDEITYL